MPHRAIAAELTRRNVPTARGGAWSAENVRSLLVRSWDAYLPSEVRRCSDIKCAKRIG